jgi:hypothetical protein
MKELHSEGLDCSYHQFCVRKWGSMKTGNAQEQTELRYELWHLKTTA